MDGVSFRLGDIRRTAETMLASMLRMWHIKIEEWMLEQAGIEQPKLNESQSLLKLVK
jgi:hypothetical protein